MPSPIDVHKLFAGGTTVCSTHHFSPNGPVLLERPCRPAWTIEVPKLVGNGRWLREERCLGALDKGAGGEQVQAALAVRQSRVACMAFPPKDFGIVLIRLRKAAR